MGRFKGKSVIVTGGAKGIGRSICLKFAAEGADVAIWDVDELASVDTAAEIKVLGRRALALRVDVGVRAEVEQAFARTIEAMPSVEVLVNNAAAISHGSILDLPEDAWDTVMRTNLKSAFLCSQQAARHWVAHNISGKIVNITSVDAEIVHTRFPHYCVAKAGLRSLTRTLALEFAPHNIRVNEVAPGFIAPGMASRITATPLWAERVGSFVPMGRHGCADEVASAVLFLSSDDASYITGAEIMVDGGHSLGAEDWILKQFYKAAAE